MLKEKLYKEYLEKYDAYRNMHRKVDAYEQEKLNIDCEFDDMERSAQEKFQKEMNRLSNERDLLHKKLKELREGHGNPEVVKKYNSDKFQEISACEKEVQQWEKERDEQTQKLKALKDAELFELSQARKNCQESLDDLQSQSTGGEGVTTFSEEKFRQSLLEQQRKEREQTQKDYDTSIAELKQQLDDMDAQYETKLKDELARFTVDMYAMDTYDHLMEKREKNELPAVLCDALDEDIASFVDRREITTGKEVDELTNMASSLTHLEGFAPSWLKFVLKAGLPILAGLALLALFLFGGINFGFVGVAANWIVTVLFWALCAVVGFGVFYAIGSWLLHWGTGLSIVAGAVGVIVALAIGLDHFIYLPSGFLHGLELIIKVLLGGAFGGILYSILNIDSIEERVFNGAAKIGFIKKICLKHQGDWLQSNVDGYYALMNYKELVPYLLEREKSEITEDLKNRLDALMAEKEEKLSTIERQHKADLESKVSAEKTAAESSRKQHEKQQMELFMAQDKCMMELAGYDEKMKAVTKKYEDRIDLVKADFSNRIKSHKEKIKELKAGASLGIDQLIEECISRDAGIEQMQQNLREANEAEMCEIAARRSEKHQQIDEEIAALNRSFEPAVKELSSLFTTIAVPSAENLVGLEESRGQLSDKIYLCHSKGNENPKRFHELRHNKKPIIFLYDTMETTKISSLLSEFMMEIFTAFLMINARQVLDLSVIELTGGTSFYRNSYIQVVEKEGIKKLFDDIATLRKEIASSQTANGSLDEFNQYIYDSGEDKSKYKKYKIVQFVVPEEEAVQETNIFDANNWNNLVESERYGFLPIFFINYKDWANTFDDENRLNSKFIRHLKNVLGDEANTYKITNEDIKRITFKKF
ncbi:MAG: hypothetical protein E7418_02145 [Ruminococcaceae bacterium]|nr:hypothetical protein [Oscillospiraceae bacterium]